MALDFVSLLVAILVILLLGSYYVGTKKNVKNKEEEAKKVQQKHANKDETKHQGNSKSNRKQTNKSKKNLKSTTSNKKTASSSSSSSSKNPIPSDPHFIKRYGGHSGTSRIVAFCVSPDGEFVATSGTDGQIRVTNTKIPDFHLSTTVQTPGMGVFQDCVSAISWLPNNDTNNITTSSSSNSNNHPTIVAVIHKSRQIVFYRIRKKKSPTGKPAGGGNAKANNKNLSSQYELIELVKRRFDISKKIEDDVHVTDCITDPHQSQHWLVLTKTEYDPKQRGHPNTVAWNGDDGSAISLINIHSSGIRISPDGKFVCGRTDFNTNEIKIYEVQRKKHKGESQPIFDSISSKSVMTIVIPKDATTTKGAKISDISFCGDRDNIKLDNHISLCIVGCDDGTILVFDINVEYQQKEDPKFVCCYQLLKDDDSETAINRRKICCISATAITNSNSNNDKDHHEDLYRVAVATDDSALHILSYSIQNAQLSLDLTIPRTHPEGVGEVQFCPSAGNILYTTGNQHHPNNRSIYSWRLSS